VATASLSSRHPRCSVAGLASTTAGTAWWNPPDPSQSLPPSAAAPPGCFATVPPLTSASLPSSTCSSRRLAALAQGCPTSPYCALGWHCPRHAGHPTCQG
jgi:hypothetical protein